MTAHEDYDADDYGEGDWDETDEAEAGHDDDPAELAACPKCGCDVYEESEQCPLCGEWITHDTSSWTGRPLWWIALGLLGIIAVIVLFSVGF